MSEDERPPEDEEWSAGARLYAGRVDPSWRVPADRARALLVLWASLPPSARSHPAGAGVGYRGCWLRAPDGSSWVVTGGLAAERSRSSTAVRRDEQRAFERALLETAPAGLLPAALVPSLGR
jgi:hypothetical protein